MVLCGNKKEYCLMRRQLILLFFILTQINCNLYFLLVGDLGTTIWYINHVK